MEAQDIVIVFEHKSYVDLAKRERLHPRIDLAQSSTTVTCSSEGQISRQGSDLRVDMRYCSSLSLLFGPLGAFLSGAFTRVQSVALPPADVLKLVISEASGRPMYHLFVRGPKGIGGKARTDVIVFTSLKQEDREPLHSLLLATIPTEKVSEQKPSSNREA